MHLLDLFIKMEVKQKKKDINMAWQDDYILGKEVGTIESQTLVEPKQISVEHVVRFYPPKRLVRSCQRQLHLIHNTHKTSHFLLGGLDMPCG